MLQTCLWVQLIKWSKRHHWMQQMSGMKTSRTNFLWVFKAEQDDFFSMSGTLFNWMLLNFRLYGSMSLIQSVSCLSCHQMSWCCSGSHWLWVARRRRIFWRWHLHRLTHLVLWRSFFHRLPHWWLLLRFEIESNLRRRYLLWGRAESSGSSVDLKDRFLR